MKRNIQNCILSLNLNREYLKHREETVRVILVSLTEESGELSEELIRNPINVDKKTKINMANWKTCEPGNSLYLL